MIPIGSRAGIGRNLASLAAVAACMVAGPAVAAGDPEQRPPVSAAPLTAPATDARFLLVDDTVGDPGFTPDSAADSPTESSGAFDTGRGDLGEDNDLAARAGQRRRRIAPHEPVPAVDAPDPLAGTPRIDPSTTGADAERMLTTMLPRRDDSPRDWQATIEPLHACGEPRALPPCVPPPPCHPADPPAPFDLVGVAGMPTCGPIYRGPCAPRSASPHTGAFRWLHAAHDRFFDLFYTPR